MSETTGISWTDSTFNPWWGCTKVSAGCDHCYAETFDKRTGGDHWGKGAERRVFADKHWNEPLKWNRDAVGKTHRVFCASMADVMDDEAPAGQRERLWELIDSTPYLTWQLLTKRPHRFSRYLPYRFAHKNVWLGCTAENQEMYDVRWPLLRQASLEYDLTSFISYEPAIGSVSMHDCADRHPEWKANEFPGWLIFGGETGAGRREMQAQWAESIAKECLDNGTAFFMKQMSAVNPTKAKELIPIELLIHEFPA